MRRVHPGNLLITASTRTTPGTGLASVSLSLIPAGARVWGVTCAVLTALGQSQGLTGFSVGDSLLVDRWGDTISPREGTETSMVDFNDGSLPIYPTADNVVISAVGGTFNGAGVLEVTAHYDLLTHVGL